MSAVPPRRDPGGLRRRLLLGAAGAGAAALSPLGQRIARAAPPDAIDEPNVSHPPAASFAAPRQLVPIQARADRIIAINVCTRPFRAAGPRIETEQLGRQTVVHNYGHGGSGWSLSWGSAMLAV